MENKILFVNYCLQLAGAEKFVYELCKFAKDNSFNPVVLIPNNLEKEYYDDVLERGGVKVVRVNLVGLKNAIKSRNWNCIYWNFLIRFGLEYKFTSVNFINLVIAERYHSKFNFQKKNFWHITNRIQYPNFKYHFNHALFNNENNTIIYCNESQIEEIKEQYGNIKSKEILFKLFLHKT